MVVEEQAKNPSEINSENVRNDETAAAELPTQSKVARNADNDNVGTRLRFRFQSAAAPVPSDSKGESSPSHQVTPLVPHQSVLDNASVLASNPSHLLLTFFTSFGTVTEYTCEYITTGKEPFYKGTVSIASVHAVLRLLEVANGGALFSFLTNVFSLTLESKLNIPTLPKVTVEVQCTEATSKQIKLDHVLARFRKYGTIVQVDVSGHRSSSSNKAVRKIQVIFQNASSCYKAFEDCREFVRNSTPFVFYDHKPITATSYCAVLLPVKIITAVSSIADIAKSSLTANEVKTNIVQDRGEVAADDDSAGIENILDDHLHVAITHQDEVGIVSQPNSKNCEESDIGSTTDNDVSPVRNNSVRNRRNSMDALQSSSIDAKLTSNKIVGVNNVETKLNPHQNLHDTQVNDLKSTSDNATVATNLIKPTSSISAESQTTLVERSLKQKRQRTIETRKGNLEAKPHDTESSSDASKTRLDPVCLLISHSRNCTKQQVLGFFTAMTGVQQVEVKVNDSSSNKPQGFTFVFIECQNTANILRSKLDGMEFPIGTNEVLNVMEIESHFPSISKKRRSLIQTTDGVSSSIDGRYSDDDSEQFTTDNFQLSLEQLRLGGTAAAAGNRTSVVLQKTLQSQSQTIDTINEVQDTNNEVQDKVSIESNKEVVQSVTSNQGNNVHNDTPSTKPNTSPQDDTQNNVPNYGDTNPKDTQEGGVGESIPTSSSFECHQLQSETSPNVNDGTRLTDENQTTNVDVRVQTDEIDTITAPATPKRRTNKRPSEINHESATRKPVQHRSRNETVSDQHQNKRYSKSPKRERNKKVVKPRELLGHQVDGACSPSSKIHRTQAGVVESHITRSNDGEQSMPQWPTQRTEIAVLKSEPNTAESADELAANFQSVMGIGADGTPKVFVKSGNRSESSIVKVEHVENRTRTNLSQQSQDQSTVSQYQYGHGGPHTPPPSAPHTAPRLYPSSGGAITSSPSTQQQHGYIQQQYIPYHPQHVPPATQVPYDTNHQVYPAEYVWEVPPHGHHHSNSGSAHVQQHHPQHITEQQRLPPSGHHPRGPMPPHQQQFSYQTNAPQHQVYYPNGQSPGYTNWNYSNSPIQQGHTSFAAAEYGLNTTQLQLPVTHHSNFYPPAHQLRDSTIPDPRGNAAGVTPLLPIRQGVSDNSIVNSRLHVSFQQPMSEGVLLEAFQGAAPGCEYVSKHDGKLYAFVKFASEESATLARQRLHGAVVAGQILKVNIAEPPPSRKRLRPSESAANPNGNPNRNKPS